MLLLLLACTPSPTTPPPAVEATEAAPVAETRRQGDVLPEDGGPPLAMRCGEHPRESACFVRSTGGTLSLGDDTVTVRPFWIQRHEVHAKLFAACVEAGACSADAVVPAAISRADILDLALSQVSWSGAGQVCAWLGGRLPTEAEWVFAATMGDGRPWPWGKEDRCPVFLPSDRVDEKFQGEVMTTCTPLIARLSTTLNDNALSALGDRLAMWPEEAIRTACTTLMEVDDAHLVERATAYIVDKHASMAVSDMSRCVHDETVAIGSLRPGHPLGMTGLAGNVAEWVSDRWSPESDRRVIRGGSFLTPPESWRTTARASLPEATRARDVGLRCAWDSP